jgi:hypothetical protein
MGTIPQCGKAGWRTGQFCCARYGRTHRVNWHHIHHPIQVGDTAIYFDVAHADFTPVAPGVPRTVCEM